MVRDEARRDTGADEVTVVGDNESEILKLVKTLPKETDKV